MIDAVWNNFPTDFVPPTFDIREIDIEIEINIINSLTSRLCCSYDGITSYLIKSIKHQITPILVYDDPTNYRPISILPTLGKLLERIIHNQLYHHLTSNNLLMAKQSGFRKGYFTGTCIVDLLHTIYGEVDD